MDGGVRLGTDVLKALALGARAVFIGRPVIWGLAYQVWWCIVFGFAVFKLSLCLSVVLLSGRRRCA